MDEEQVRAIVQDEIVKLLTPAFTAASDALSALASIPFTNLVRFGNISNLAELLGEAQDVE